MELIDDNVMISTRCGCCGTTLAGARYRMAVWEV